MNDTNSGLKVENPEIKVSTYLEFYNLVRFKNTSCLIGPSSFKQDSYGFNEEYYTFKANKFTTTVPLNEYYSRYIKKNKEYTGSVFNSGTLSIWIIEAVGSLFVVAAITGVSIKVFKKKSDTFA